MKDLNFIPKKYLIKQQNKERSTMLILGIGGFGIILGISVLVPFWTTYTLETDLDGWKKKVIESNNFVNTENQFNKIKEIYKTREVTVANLTDKNININEILSKLEGICPKNVAIAKLNVDFTNEQNVQVLVNCEAKGEEDIASFVNNIKKDEYFKDMQFSGYSVGQTDKNDKNDDTKAIGGITFTVKLISNIKR